MLMFAGIFGGGGNDEERGNPLALLALALLGFAADRLSRAEALGLQGVAALAAAAHLSHLPLAVALAAVNVFGGFLVTRRMLEMFRKKERKAPATAAAAGAKGEAQ